MDGYDVWGQWIDTMGEAMLAENFRLSDLGGEVGDTYNGGFSRAAWNPAANEFLVVFWGDESAASGGPGDDDGEVFGQRVSAAAIFADGFESGDVSAW